MEVNSIGKAAMSEKLIFYVDRRAGQMLSTRTTGIQSADQGQNKVEPFNQTKVGRVTRQRHGDVYFYASTVALEAFSPV